MTNYHYNIIFWIYLIILPWIGLVVNIKVPYNKKRLIIYGSTIFTSCILWMVGVTFVNFISGFLFLLVVCYMCSEIMWLAIDWENKFFSWLAITSAVFFVYLIVLVFFVGSDKGLRFFPEEKLIASSVDGPWVGQIVEREHFVPDNNWNSYSYHYGIKNFPLKYKRRLWNVGGSECRHCINDAVWETYNNKTVVKLLKDGKIIESLKL